LVAAKTCLLEPFYNSQTKEFVLLNNVGVLYDMKTAKSAEIDLRNFHFICVLCFNDIPLKHCISNHMRQRK
jgi:hypothetical protein